MIDIITEILWRHDPGSVGSVRHNLLDEYEDESLKFLELVDIEVDSLSHSLIKDLLHEVFTSTFGEGLFSLSEELVNEIYEKLKRG